VAYNSLTENNKIKLLTCIEGAHVEVVYISVILFLASDLNVTDHRNPDNNLESNCLE
jgi:hypothetical protein